MTISLPTTVLKQLPGKPLDRHGNVVRCLLPKGPGGLGDHWVWCAVDGPKVEILPGTRLLSIEWPPTPLERLGDSLNGVWQGVRGFCQHVLAQAWQAAKRAGPQAPETGHSVRHHDLDPRRRSACTGRAAAHAGTVRSFQPASS